MAPKQTFTLDESVRIIDGPFDTFTGTVEEAPPVRRAAPDSLPEGVPLKQVDMFEEMKVEEPADPLLDSAIDLIRREGRASISMLQRRLRIGYTRAARLVETIEEKGIISAPMPGSQIREVLDWGPTAPPPD